ncbi:MAG: hypothetical protein ACOZNI_32405 [Myxococcota bacterium]
MLLLLACTSEDAPAGGDDVVAVPQDDACDNLNPAYCLLPWPSDRYLVADDATPTGWRLAYDSDAFPPSSQGNPMDVEPYGRLDGMSPGSQILTMFDAPPDLSGAAGADDIGRSLDEDSPTVVVDLATGERVPHFVENDAQAESADRTLVLVHPAVRLRPDADYAVVFRDLADAEGNALAPPVAMQALLDGKHTDAPDVEARWDAYREMLATLDELGLRDGIVQAWRFHTASDETLHRDLLAMRADALERLGPDGIGCTVESVEEGYGEGTAITSFRRVRGTYTVPSYMDDPEPPARLVRGDDDLPTYVEDVEVTFTAIVPHSLADVPTAGPVVTFGHGLLGDAEGTLSDERIRYSADNGGVVIVGTDWAGMSTDDLVTVAGILADVSTFPYLSDRLHQAMVNQLALTRTFAGVCASHEAFAVDGVSLIDPTRRYYTGVSQGGILGGTYLTLAEDIERGVLLVNGAEFPFMMERSIAFAPYFPTFAAYYTDRVDRAVLLASAQHLWDHTDPNAWLGYTTSGIPEADVPPHAVLSIAALNDAQVPNLTSDLANRIAGVPILAGSAREAWGFDVVDASQATSGYVTIDMGDPEVPEGNVAPTVDAGGHSNVGVADAAQAMMIQFLGTGTLTMPCDGVCDPN